MHQNIAIKLLKILEEDELKKFGEYVRSPYFNKSDTLIRLYESVYKCYPDFNSRSLKKEILYEKIYPGKKFNGQNLKNRMTEFTALIKDFLSRDEYENDAIKKKTGLGKIFYKKKGFSHAEKAFNEALALVESEKVHNLDYFREKYHIYSELQHMKLACDSKAQSLRYSFEKAGNFIFYALINILQTEGDLSISRIELKDKPEWNALKEFLNRFDFSGYLEEIKKHDAVNYPQIAIYYYGNLSLTEPDNEEIFYMLKDLIFRNFMKFDELSIYNFWAILSNSAFLLYLKIGERFALECHEIDKFFVSNRLYPKDRPFSSQAYQNIVIIATMVNNLNWAEEFAIEHKYKLVEDTRENRFKYAMSLIEFEKGNYDTSLQYLSDLEFHSVFDKLNTRLNLLKNYYELGWWEQVQSILDSLKHYVSQSREIPDYAIERLRKMLRHISKAAEAKFGEQKLDLADYITAKNDAPFQISTWVLRKMEELL